MALNPFNLTHKTAIVTGASSLGLGRHFAKTLEKAYQCIGMATSQI